MPVPEDRTSLPFVAFTNAELATLPSVKPGDAFDCPTCGGKHILEHSRPVSGQDAVSALFYRCGGHLFLGAVAGRLIV